MKRVNVIIFYYTLKIDLDRSSYVKSLNDSKILKKRQNKNQAIINKKPTESNIYGDCSIEKIKQKYDLENFDVKGNLTISVDKLKAIKDISGITQKDNFYIKDNISNSIFHLDNMSTENFNQDNEELDKFKILRSDNNNLTTTDSKNYDATQKNNESAKALGEIYFNVNIYL